MNIELQSCGLFIMIVIFIMFCYEKKLDLVNRKLYFKTACVCVACLIFDIVSIIMLHVANEQHDVGFDTVTKMVCKV